jgi:hypothetical protein
MAISFMSAFRRRLASGALALIVLQLALLLTAPVSACCASGDIGTKAKAGTKIECCPAGSHAPGECPLHKSSDRESKDSDCRITCGSPQGPQFLLGVVGVLGAPQSTYVDLTASALHAVAPVSVTARPSVPDAPPPRLL